MNKLLVVISMLLLTTSVVAEEVKLEQFAKGIELKTDGSAAMYRISLPDSVYQTSVRQDLGDIRVFNQDKKRVPHAIRRAQSNQEEKIIHLDLAFFPLHRSDNAENNGEQDPEIIVADDGTLMLIKYPYIS